MSGVVAWFLISGALVAGFIAADMWMDRRPGGRKADQHLDYLRSHERYRAALKRQHEQHIRLGHREK